MTRPSMRGLVAGCALALLPVVADAVAGDATAVILARAYIPSADNVHGETRVQRTGEGACCVQTILHSPSIRRGIREIREREAALWPENRQGYADSQRYLEALEHAKQAVVAVPRTAEQAGLPYTLVMDFVFQPGRSFIELGSATVARDPVGFSIVSNSPLVRVDVSDDYMSRAMLVMTSSALDRHDAVDALTAAGWQDRSEPVDPAAPAPVR